MKYDGPKINVIIPRCVFISDVLITIGRARYFCPEKKNATKINYVHSIITHWIK